MTSASPVFILTDFGNTDTYVAQMKSVILQFAGHGTPLIDLTHSVERGSVLSGAFHLSVSLPHLPAGSVTLAVVDPGVGGRRKGIAARWRDRFLICPDNGLISLLDPVPETRILPEPGEGASHTFHGRDWFAPAAARLSLDPLWMERLDPLCSPVTVDLPRPDDAEDVRVLHVDRFGNCVLSLHDDFPIQGFCSLRMPGRDPMPIRPSDHYCEAGQDDVLLLRGSQGYLEVAVRDGSAADLLKLRAGSGLILEKEVRGL